MTHSSNIQQSNVENFALIPRNIYGGDIEVMMIAHILLAADTRVTASNSSSDIF
jgi:hypothetical protein